MVKTSWFKNRVGQKTAGFYYNKTRGGQNQLVFIIKENREGSKNPWFKTSIPANFIINQLVFTTLSCEKTKN